MYIYIYNIHTYVCVIICDLGFQDMDCDHFCNLDCWVSDDQTWNLLPGRREGDRNLHPTNGMDSTDPCPIPPWWVPHLEATRRPKKWYVATAMKIFLIEKIGAISKKTPNTIGSKEIAQNTPYISIQNQINIPTIPWENDQKRIVCKQRRTWFLGPKSPKSAKSSGVTFSGASFSGGSSPEWHSISETSQPAPGQVGNSHPGPPGPFFV